MNPDELRALADAQPVAEVNDRYSRDGYNDEISVLLPVGTKLYTHPAPAVPQAEPKREPLSDEQIDAALQTNPVLITRLMIGSMTVSEFRAALRRLARIVEHAHGISGGRHE